MTGQATLRTQRILLVPLAEEHLEYERDLFHERQLRSVTANTRADGEEFLAIASRIPLQVRTTRYPLGDADRALRDLAHDDLTGAAVLVV